jgi:WD40 repeat protein
LSYALIAGRIDGVVDYFDGKDWRSFLAHRNDVVALAAFVIGGRTVVATTGLDRRLRLWDLSTELLLQDIQLDGVPLDLHAASPYVAVATTSGATVFEFSDDPLILSTRES